MKDTQALISIGNHVDVPTSNLLNVSFRLSCRNFIHLLALFVLVTFVCPSSYAASRGKPTSVVLIDQPAVISNASVSRSIQPGKPFTLSVRAKDDHAVTGIQIQYMGKTQTIAPQSVKTVF